MANGTGAGSWEFMTTIALATVYISLGGFRVLLIKLSANADGQFDYLPVSVNLCAEFIKLSVCSILALNSITKERLKSWSVFLFSIYDVLRLLKWSVPGLLYFLDNLIAFYVVASFEPAMVVLLNNFVIISTAVLFRVVLKRKLSRVQWASLIVLFLAIVCLSHHSHTAQAPQLVPGDTKADGGGGQTVPADKPQQHEQQEQQQQQQHEASRCLETERSELALSQCFAQRQGRPPCPAPATTQWRVVSHLQVLLLLGKYQGFVWVLLQCFISSLANIYNEKIFKEGRGFEESIYTQNTKLYFFGVLINLGSIAGTERFRRRIGSCGLFDGFNVFAGLLVLDSALMGLSISLILKFRDNMFHVLCSQLVTVSVVTVSVAFMGFQPSVEFLLQAPIVLLAIYIYNVSKPASSSQTHRIRTQSGSESGSPC